MFIHTCGAYINVVKVAKQKNTDKRGIVSLSFLRSVFGGRLVIVSGQMFSPREFRFDNSFLALRTF